MMLVNEAASLPAVVGGPCVDEVVITADFVAVLDAGGFDAEAAHLSPAQARARLGVAAEVIGGLAEDVDAHAAVSAVSERLASTGGDAVLSMACFSVLRREVWLVGSCQYWWQGRTIKARERGVDVAIAARKLAYEALRNDGLGDAAHRATRAVGPLIAALTATTNTPNGGYGVARLTGTPVPEELVRVHPLMGTGKLVLATDGYPHIAGDAEPQQAAAEAWLEELLSRDPDCVRELAGLTPVIWGPRETTGPGGSGLRGRGAPWCRGSFDSRAWVGVDLAEER